MPSARSGRASWCSGGSCAKDATAQAAASTSRPSRSRRPTRIARTARSPDRSRSTAPPGRIPSAMPTGVARTKPAFGVLEQHARRRERVQPEERRRDEEGERDEEDARVAAPDGHRPGAVGERGADRRGSQHEPEVRGVVLPVHVELRPSHQQGEADQRQREQRPPTPASIRDE